MTAALPQKRKRVSEIRLVDAPNEFAPRLSDPMAERALIGSVFHKPDLYPLLSNTVQPSDFAEILHGYIWWACEQVYPAINNITVLECIHSKIGDPAAINTRINDMIAGVPDINQAESYARIVRERARLIRMYNATEEMRGVIFDSQLSAEQIIDRCNHILFEASEQTCQPDTSARALIDSLWEDLESADKREGAPGIRFGLPCFDDLFHRLYAGEVAVLVGHPGMGKTTLLLSLVHDAIRHNPEKRIVFFSMEQTQREIMTILASMETGLHKALFMEKKFSSNQWAHFIARAPAIANWKLDIIDEFSAMTCTQLRRKLRYLFRESPVDLVVLDGLWLMEPETPSEKRWRDVHYITQDLTDIAKKEFGVPILISHQYNQEARLRKDKRPLIHDVAEGAAIQRNLHLILAMYRQSYFDHDSENNTTRLYVVKDRIRGKSGQYIELRYELGKFKEKPLL